MAETSTVIGVFEDHNHAEQAIQELKQAGWRDDQLGFVVRHQNKTQRDTGERRHVVAGGVIAGLLGAIDALLLPVIGPTDAANVLATGVPAAEQVLDRFRGERRTPTEAAQPAGVTSTAGTSGADEDVDPESGATEGGVEATTGAVFGGSLGLAAALLIPGIGPVIAGGALVTAVASAVLGAMSGGIIGAFTSMGVPEHAAHKYAREFEAGRTIVTVKTADRLDEAVTILRHAGAHEVEAH